MKNSQNGFAGIVLVVVIAIIAICGGVYIYTKTKGNTPVAGDTSLVPDKKIAAETEQGPSMLPAISKTIDSKKETAGTVTTTKDVKGDSPGFSYEADLIGTENCGSEGCFEQKFKTCDPAIITVKTYLTAVEYKILGKGTSGCNLTFKYTEYGDPSWVNKEMTCEFDNKIGFEKSFEKVFAGIATGEVVCKGPLYKILHP